MGFTLAGACLIGWPFCIAAGFCTALHGILGLVLLGSWGGDFCPGWSFCVVRTVPSAGLLRAWNTKESMNMLKLIFFIKNQVVNGYVTEYTI